MTTLFEQFGTADFDSYDSYGWYGMACIRTVIAVGIVFVAVPFRHTAMGLFLCLGSGDAVDGMLCYDFLHLPMYVFIIKTITLI